MDVEWLLLNTDEEEDEEQQLVDLNTTELAWTLFVVCHFLVTLNLYFGLNLVSCDNNIGNLHNYLDIPHFVAISSLFIYFGLLCPSSAWNLYFTTHPRLTFTNTCQVLSTTLPTMSISFSVVGIMTILSDYFWLTSSGFSGAVNWDEWWLIFLYLANIMFLIILSKAMGLWLFGLGLKVDSLLSKDNIKVNKKDEEIEKEQENNEIDKLQELKTKLAAVA